MTDILSYSTQMRLNADKILSTSQLLETLSTFGTVKPIGSYAYDLMFDPDIDLVVTCDRTRECAVAALKSLVNTAIFSRYEFGDFVQFSQYDRPHGYILVLQMPYENKLWEIEIWFKSVDEYQSDKWQTQLKAITPDQRRVILEIKKERAAKGIEKKKLSSVNIYEGVLSKGHKSFADF